MSIKAPFFALKWRYVMVDVTILMPCLNEEKTIGICINEALDFFEKNSINGEVLIADNGSSDGSVEIAKEYGVRVINVEENGYGNTLRRGICEANGTCVVMGDSDYSYDFSRIDDFVNGIQEGYDMVLGNRFRGHMEKGAMPFLHKYLGVPVLSFLASIRFKTPVYDYHCGLRSVNREKYLQIPFNSEGMEFATEMIGKFAKAGYTIKVVPIDFRKDKRGGPSHLKSIRDGVRHLSLILKRKSQL